MIIIGFAHSDEASHHRVGRALRDEMFARFLNLPSPRIVRDHFGKPRADGAMFSVSHSAQLVICAVFSDKISCPDIVSNGETITLGGDTQFLAIDAASCGDIGADIEEISPKRTLARICALAERYFSAEECRIIEESTNPRAEFYRFWTRKESYLKLTGHGLSRLSSADTLSLPENLSETAFTVLSGAKSYAVCVCVKSTD